MQITFVISRDSGSNYVTVHFLYFCWAHVDRSPPVMSWSHNTSRPEPQCGNRNYTYHGFAMREDSVNPTSLYEANYFSKAAVVCSVTEAMFIDFCLKKLNVFSQHIGKKKMNI